MKKISIATISILIFLFIISCGKNEDKDKTTSTKDVNYYNSENYLTLKTSDYKKNITIPLEKKEGCDYPVKGRIEYIKENKTLAVIDYGNGKCDDIATKTINDKIYNYSLSKKEQNKGDNYKKIITNPLVEIQGCNYIVDGTIEYYKEQKLIATIDYGDGSCDNIATKSADGEIYTFQIKEKN